MDSEQIVPALIIIAIVVLAIIVAPHMGNMHVDTNSIVATRMLMLGRLP